MANCLEERDAVTPGCDWVACLFSCSVPAHSQEISPVLHRSDKNTGTFMAKKEEAFEVEGTVTQALANTRFKVQLDTGTEVLAHVAGRMRKNFIRIVPGDKVRVELSPYDLTRGRIIFRER